MLDTVLLTLALLKLLFAALLLRQAHGMTRAMRRMKGATFPPADVARLKARVLTEVERVKAVQA